MVKLDPRAGSHFDGRSIEITTHAEAEARKKFGIRHKAARQWIETNLRRAQYIGEILSDKGECVRLYGYNRIAFIVQLKRDVVITVYPRTSSAQTMSTKISELILKEIRKINRAVVSAERRAVLKKADLKVELAETERRLVRTRSDAVRLACEARIKAVKDEIEAIDAEIARKRQEQSTFLKGVVAYV